ncbi:MAG: hypothetical protein LBK70_03265 [Clostridiales bacterium]|jgi:4-diphosphocytidyl-2-C-methyl-D-erythritol kinase|nr:hypothetical protein [Clostridiales bacterium]
MIKINAKINLSLRILAKQGALHILDTIMMNVPQLYDIVSIKMRTDRRIILHMTALPNFAQCQLHLLRHLSDNYQYNTAYKAAKLLQDKYNLCGLDIHLTKGIPMQAGLGGSAAAAAGVINLLDSMCSLQLSTRDKMDLGLQLGADVPYMLIGGCVRQVDNQLHSIDSNVKQHNLIVLSNSQGISTRDCFDKFAREFARYSQIHDNDKLCDMLVNCSCIDSSWSEYVYNELTQPSISLDFNIAKSIELLQYSGAIVANMTGSGSACFGIYPTSVDVYQIVKQLQSQCNYVYACTVA